MVTCIQKHSSGNDDDDGLGIVIMNQVMRPKFIQDKMEDETALVRFKTINGFTRFSSLTDKEHPDGLRGAPDIGGGEFIGVETEVLDL